MDDIEGLLFDTGFERVTAASARGTDGVMLVTAMNGLAEPSRMGCALVPLETLPG